VQVTKEVSQPKLHRAPVTLTTGEGRRAFDACGNGASYLWAMCIRPELFARDCAEAVAIAARLGLIA